MELKDELLFELSTEDKCIKRDKQSPTPEEYLEMKACRQVSCPTGKISCSLDGASFSLFCHHLKNKDFHTCIYSDHSKNKDL